MNWTSKKAVRVAILDMNEGRPNQGMRCIREILNQFGDANNLDLEWDEFEVRLQKQTPSLNYDIYISSGGPGSPLESEGSDWEEVYFNWLQDVMSWNASAANVQKKKVFFICHSYQLACRHFKIATVCKRKSTAFGVFPVHLLPVANEETVFSGLRNPFYSVDSRDYQVIEPNHNKLHQMGASILAIEKERPHVPLERAIMAIRFNDNMIGTQFHPEADAVGMSMHLQTEDKKKTVIENYGKEKWESMIDHLNDPDKIMWTYAHILPNFLYLAVDSLQLVEV
ncbi:type 1 glutamine amidotransferase [Ferruginibacter sp.]|nr:GMP synthase [Ferruginibacter sp.]